MWLHLHSIDCFLYSFAFLKVKMINDLLLGGCVVRELIGSMCRAYIYIQKLYSTYSLPNILLEEKKKRIFTDERNLLIRKIIIKGKSNFIFAASFDKVMIMIISCGCSSISRYCLFGMHMVYHSMNALSWCETLNGFFMIRFFFFFVISSTHWYLMNSK